MSENNFRSQKMPLVEELSVRAVACCLAEKALSPTEIEAITRYHIAFRNAICSVPLDKVFDEEKTVHRIAAANEPEGWEAMQKLNSLAVSILRAGRDS